MNGEFMMEKRVNGPALIPEPVSVEYGNDFFELTPDTVLVSDEASVGTAGQLAACLRPATGFDLATASSPVPNRPVIALAEDNGFTGLGPEGYRLEVTPERISLTAPTQTGLFYAVQTLRQLLPSQIFSAEIVADFEWQIPCVRITDYPRFAWRGFMLDTGHYYQQVSYIYRFIDLMALHKFNVFHWHIVDLGTFPLEINGYPKLQDHSTLGKRLRGEPPRGVKPGRYTQEQVREIVQYAAERHITVMPEIDMPGHSYPALMAYPEYDCPVPHQTWEWERWEYCVGNEKTYDFLQEILAQAIELFPSQFIHIGADECPKDHWKKCPICQAKMQAEGLKDEEELQSYFVRRIERFLNSKGRRLIGWDEILEGGIAPNAAVMAWRVEQGAASIAAQSGHDVVMALTSHLYFDYSEAMTPVEKVYEFEPLPEGLTPEQARHILGAQAQLWSDNHPTEPEIDRLVYPRSCAVAEVVWSPADARDYGSFSGRLAVHQQRLAALGIDWTSPVPA